jgi:integrase/recombinase XerD
MLRAYVQERGVLDTGRLFISIENQPIGARSIQDRLRIYGKQTGVCKEVTDIPQAFRRIFCRLKV